MWTWMSNIKRGRALTRGTPGKITVSVQDGQWLRNAAGEWNVVADSAKVDPLFMSWDWISHWWTFFENESTGSPLILLASNNEHEIVGIAPFYRTCHSRRKIKTYRIQLMGNIWRRETGILSERMDWICKSGWRDEVGEAFYNFLENELEWDELVISLSAASSAILQALPNFLSKHSKYCRMEGEINSFLVRGEGGYGEFLEGLSASSRARLHNRRTRLERHGAVRTELATPATTDEILQEMFALHRTRWGTEVSPSAQSFLSSFCQVCANKGKLRLSKLVVGDAVVSVVLGIQAGSSEYNLQSAFDHTFDKKVSLGLLHLGYELERVFDHEKLDYDLLAGGGMKTQFKESVASANESFQSLQIIRSPVRRILYKLYDHVRR